LQQSISKKQGNKPKISFLFCFKFFLKISTSTAHTRYFLKILFCTSKANLAEIVRASTCASILHRLNSHIRALIKYSRNTNTPSELYLNREHRKGAKIWRFAVPSKGEDYWSFTKLV